MGNNLFETTPDYGGQPPANVRTPRKFRGEKKICFYQLFWLFPILKHMGEKSRCARCESI
jgi:hypothetical protein